MLSILMEGNFHSCVKNDVRATMASSVSLVDSFFVMLLAPAIGWLGQEVGLAAGVSISAIVYFVLLILVLVRKKLVKS